VGSRPLEKKKGKRKNGSALTRSDFPTAQEQIFTRHQVGRRGGGKREGVRQGTIFRLDYNASGSDQVLRPYSKSGKEKKKKEEGGGGEENGGNSARLWVMRTDWSAIGLHQKRRGDRGGFIYVHIMRGVREISTTAATGMKERKKRGRRGMVADGVVFDGWANPYLSPTT